MAVRFKNLVIPSLLKSRSWDKFFEELLQLEDKYVPYKYLSYNGFPYVIELTNDYYKSMIADSVHVGAAYLSSSYLAAAETLAEIVLNEEAPSVPMDPKESTVDTVNNFDRGIYKEKVLDGSISEVLTTDVRQNLAGEIITAQGKEFTGEEVLKFIDFVASDSGGTVGSESQYIDVSDLPVRFDIAGDMIEYNSRYVKIYYDYVPPVDVYTEGCKILVDGKYLTEGTLTTQEFTVKLTSDKAKIYCKNRPNDINWNALSELYKPQVRSTTPLLQIYPTVQSILEALHSRGIYFKIAYGTDSDFETSSKDVLYKGALIWEEVPVYFLGEYTPVKCLMTGFAVNVETDYVFAKEPRAIFGYDKRWIVFGDTDVDVYEYAGKHDTAMNQPISIPSGGVPVVTSQDEKIAVRSSEFYGNSLLRKNGLILVTEGTFTGVIIITFEDDLTEEQLEFVKSLEDVIPMRCTLVLRDKNVTVEDELKIIDTSK